MESSSSTDLVVVGRVVKPHGVRGDVVVVPESDDPRRFRPGAVLRLEDGVELEIEHSRRANGALLVAFAGHHDRDDAERLRGVSLFVRETERRTLDPDEYWPDQLVGLQARDPDGERIGEVIEVVEGAAQFRLVIRGAGRVFEVPFVAALVPEVSTEDGYVVIEPIAGLIDPS